MTRAVANTPRHTHYLRRPARPPSGQRRAAVREGFSLLEMLLAVAVMAVLAGIAVPRFARANARFQVDAAVARLTADLARARGEARAMSQARTVVFDTSDGTYAITQSRALDGAGTGSRVALGAEPYRVLLVAVYMDDSSSMVRFNGYGTPVSAGMIHLACGSETRTVKIGADGTVTVLKTLIDPAPKRDTTPTGPQILPDTDLGAV